MQNRVQKNKKSGFRFIKNIILFLFITALLISLYIFFMYPIKYSSYIEKYSKEYEIDEVVIYSVILAESKFRNDAISTKEAKGLMQITDATGEWIASQIGDKNFEADMLFDPETNIKYGTWYLNNLSKQFSNQDTVFAAYNAGRGNVSKWLSNEEYSKDGITLYEIPFNETKNYIKSVNRNIEVYSKTLMLKGGF